MNPRPRSVVSPELPSRAKPKPAAPERDHHVLPGRTYRLRPTSVNPFGEVDKPTYGDDLGPLEREQEQLASLGIESILEEHITGGYRPYAGGSS